MLKIKKLKKTKTKKNNLTECAKSKIVEYLKIGCTISECAKLIEISEDKLKKEIVFDENFQKRVEKAQQNQYLIARKCLINGIENNPELALKFLERKKRDEFSLKINNENENRTQIQIYLPNVDTKLIEQNETKFLE